MAKAGAPTTNSPSVDALVHSLEVHQAELEVQNNELIAANEELRRSNATLSMAYDRYQALHDVAPVALITIDKLGTIVAVNRAAEDALRTTRAALIDRRLALFVAEGARERLAATIADVFARGAVHGVDVGLTLPGDVVFAAVIDGVVLDGTGAARAILAMADVTDRRHAEESARVVSRRADDAQRRESLGTLAGGIAHDFNNLLTIIIGGTDHALALIRDNDGVTRALADVQLAGRHAADLVRQMMVDAGQVTAPAKPLALGPLVQALTPLLQAAAQATPVRIELAPALPPIRGDEVGLRQVIVNLVINAAEAMQGRTGNITVSTMIGQPSAADLARWPAGAAFTTGPWVVLAVHDEGVGMPPETLARIFDPYYSTKFAGRGLGLAVVQGIVRGHHGALTVHSTVGEGTTFRVYLPIGEAPGARPAVTPAPRAKTPPLTRSTGTVLIVEDDEHVRTTISRLVARLGFEVLTAPSGADALVIIQAAAVTIDVVLTDLTMPAMDGVALGHAIREVRPTLPLVLVTGYGHVPASAEGLFAAVLAKPFDLTALEEVLNRLVPADGIPRSSP